MSNKLTRQRGSGAPKVEWGSNHLQSSQIIGQVGQYAPIARPSKYHLSHLAITKLKKKKKNVIKKY